MRLSELQGYRTFDANGEPLDHVKDVRVEIRDDGWWVTDLIVGRAAVAERLGFIHGVVERPALLARIMKWLERHAVVVPWDEVDLQPPKVLVSKPRSELQRPGEGS